MICFSVSSYAMDPEERELRRKLVYYFNPCLKYLFGYYGAERFAQYGFNSCRQTAIFGAAFAKFTMPDIAVNCFEADFDDVIHGQPVQYTHAYFKILNGTHEWLVDLSRTEKTLLFTQPDPGTIYPGLCLDYWKTKIKAVRDLDWGSAIMIPDAEWITGLQPLYLFQTVCQMVSNLEEAPPEVRHEFMNQVYKRYTKLKFERDEFRD